ncbi:MAG: hypothetical protein ACTHMI_02505 [Mucilaginibacter sp.]
MTDILLINDGSQQSFHAAEYALALAKSVKRNLLLANIVPAHQPVKITIGAGAGFIEAEEQSLADKLHIINDSYDGFHPAIKNCNLSHLNEKEVVSFINQQQLFLIILASGQQAKGFNLQSVFSRVYCPLLLLPSDIATKPIERIMYLTDLRFCQVPVLNYLGKLGYGNSINIAHICAQGLPELDGQYAEDIFSKSVSPNVKGSTLYFSHIREKDINKAVDTMIHGMHADLLVCQNRWFHFKQLFGESIPVKVPDHISVPVLIFPS